MTKGHPWNHKRVYRIYCELDLILRIKRLNGDKPDALAVPETPNMTWSIAARQVISLQLMIGGLHGGPSQGPLGRLLRNPCRATDGRAFRLLNVLDDFNRDGQHLVRPACNTATTG